MGKKDTSSEIEYFTFCHDYLRGISEMKKVSHRVASGISFFALLLLPLFPVFFYFCGSANHPFLGYRDSQPFYSLILTVTPFFSLLTVAC